MIIYKITNLINGKIYIGQSIKNNPNYFGSGKAIRKTIKKNGKENFSKDILRICSSQKQLDVMEKFFIRKFDSRNPKIGYNIAEGSTNPPNLKGVKFTQEHKDRIGKSICGENNFWYGKKMKEVNPNLSKAVIIANKIKGGPMVGKKHEQHIKDKISKKVRRGNHPLAQQVVMVMKERTFKFDCIRDASDFFGISTYKISRYYAQR